MKRFVSRITHHTKVSGAVVFSVAVDVVNCFVTIQSSAQHLLCYQSMLKNISLLCRIGMIRHKDRPIAHSVDSRQCPPFRGTFAAARTTRFLRMRESEDCAADDASSLVSLEGSSLSAFALAGQRTAHFAYRNERNKVDFANRTGPVKAMLPAYKLSRGFCHA